MDISETVVWAAMFGGLTTMAAYALIDAVMRRSIASWRAFVFVALTGAATILLTGLTNTLFPNAPLLPVHVLQNSLGLLSGALVLRYLGLWMGIAAEDRIMRITIRAGTTALIAIACTMALLTFLAQPTQWHDLLLATAVINVLAVLLPAIVAMRAVALGDRLARGMVVATLLLFGMVLGLYARALHMQLGLVVWILTAICTIAFFMLGTYLAVRRDRHQRHLARLAGLAQGDDAATGLPRGSVLISKIDDAFWRSGRRRQECTVICVHVQNLYELGDSVGHHIDQQILGTMSARLRRAVGFRNVVGLYHPRCFVVVISTDSKTRLVEKTLQRLQYLMGKPLQVTGVQGKEHLFTPRFGIGALSVNTDTATPATVLDQAERMALDAMALPEQAPPLAPANIQR